MGNESLHKGIADIAIKGENVRLKDGAVVIAAITSCTNTSNPAVMLGAGLLARNAAKLGLKAKPWVKTSLGPGSLAPRLDGSAPLGYPIKGNLDTMLSHTEASRWFQRIKADVWFDSEETARAAGFTRWDQRGTAAHTLRD